MADLSPKAISFRCFGRVQGVWYRAFTQSRARQLSLSGWVRNEVGGSVQGHAEGSEEALNAFIRHLHDGPPAARVDDVTVSWVDPKHMSQFSIRR